MSDRETTDQVARRPETLDLKALVERLIAAIDHLEICAQCGEDSLSACVTGGREALQAREDAREWLHRLQSATPGPETKQE